MGVLFISFSSGVFAQDNFSAYSTITTQTAENIKVNNFILGGNYSKKINSKFNLAADVVFNSKNIMYFGGDYSNLYLDDFKKLKSVLTFSYSSGLKYKYYFSLEPFIANEKQLKISSLYFLSQFKVDFNLKQNNILTVGIGNTSVFGKPSVIPIINYYYKYSDKLNFSIGFPEAKISYSNNTRNIFALKNDFNGSFYSLDNTSKTFLDNSTKSSFSQVTTSLEYERKMDANWFVNFKAGYDYNKKYLLLDNNYKTNFNFNIQDGYNLGLTIKYKH